MELPLSFIKELSAVLPEQKAAEVVSALGGTPSIAVRLNPLKLQDISVTGLPVSEGEAFRTYSKNGYFLSERPDFAADPLFHAGAYYVQEASSMYLETLASGYLRSAVSEDERLTSSYLDSAVSEDERLTSGYLDSVVSEDGTLTVLDLCASPGGKTTHLLSMLADFPGSVLVTNEVIRSRVGALCENVSKWGRANVVVTSQDPAAFGALGPVFDVIVADAPCSGEGMFRKDPEAVRQWSTENVALCAARQKRILTDVLPALRPEGLLVYSTCTFNHYEDEDNVRFLQDSCGMELLDMKHFYPGEPMAGEGFFFALLRNSSGSGSFAGKGTSSLGSVHRAHRMDLRTRSRKGGAPMLSVPFVKEGFATVLRGSKIWAMPSASADRMEWFAERLRAVQAGSMVASLISGAGKAASSGPGRESAWESRTSSSSASRSGRASIDLSASSGFESGVGRMSGAGKGGALILPEHGLVQSEAYARGYFPEVEISLETALTYISRGNVSLHDSPKGFILFTYKGVPLGLVKNLGNRCNNLWPENLRLRKNFSKK